MTDIGDLNRFGHLIIWFKFNEIDVFRVLDNESTLYLSQVKQPLKVAAARHFPADFLQMIFLKNVTICQFSPNNSY